MKKQIIATIRCSFGLFFSIAIWCILGWPINLYAQTETGRIVAFDFSNMSGATISKASQVNNAIYVDTSVITKSPSLFGASNTTVNGNFITTSYFVSSGWTASNALQAVSNNMYFQFTIVPKLGYEFRLDSIVLRWRSALTGATHVFIRSSLNQYATTIAGDTVTRNASGVLRMALSAPLISDSAITFRIYAYGATPGQSFGFGERPINTSNPDIDLIGRMSTALPSGTIQTGDGPLSVCQGAAVWLKHSFTGGTPPYTVFMKDGSGQVYQTVFQHNIDSVQIQPELTWSYTIDSLHDANGNQSINLTGLATFSVTPNSALSGVGIFNSSHSMSDGAFRTFGDTSICKSWVRIADSLDGIALGVTTSTLENALTCPFNATSRFFLPRKVSIGVSQVGHAMLTLYYTQSDFNAFNMLVNYQHKMPINASDVENNKLFIRVARTSGSIETASCTFLEPVSVVWNATLLHWEINVRVHDTMLNGAYYITSLFTTSKMVGAISHSSVTPTAGATTASVTINWQDVPGVTHYRFRFRPQGALNWNVSTITGSERTYNYLSFNTTYEVQIRVYESATQQGEYSQTYTFTTPSMPGTLPNCTMPIPTSTVMDAHSAQISWLPVFFSQSFQVQLRSKNSLTWGGTTTANNQVVFSDLLPNTWYEYRVRSHCTSGLTNQGLSNYSGIDSFKTPELLICSTPQNPTTVSVNATSALVSWASGSNAYLYNVQMRVKNSESWGGTSLSDSVYTFMNLSPSTTYEFRVRSVCVNEAAISTTSAFSPVAEFTTTALPLGNCLAPSPFTVNATSNSGTISWNSSANGYLYFVQIKPSTSMHWGGRSTSSTQITFNNLSVNTDYHYRIRTTCETGTTFTPMSAFSPVGTMSTTALRDALVAGNDEAYPNPTAGNITIARNSTNADLYQVSLTDMAGRLMNQTQVACAEGSTFWSFSLANYPKGLYLIRVINKAGIIRVYKIQRM